MEKQIGCLLRKTDKASHAHLDEEILSYEQSESLEHAQLNFGTKHVDVLRENFTEENEAHAAKLSMDHLSSHSGSMHGV
jgi:hypothetical protein